MRKAIAAVLLLAACNSGSKYDMGTTPPSPDRRLGLKAGWMDAEEASWNVHLVSHTAPSKDFLYPVSALGTLAFSNSDLAFKGNFVAQGNFSGYQIWNVSDPLHPRVETAYVCPGSQADVSFYKNLMFVSAEATSARMDCGSQGIDDTVSRERVRGIRMFDVTDMAHPKYIANIQTCRGSHTHTLVTPLNDPDNVYIYISGTSAVRSSKELVGCSGEVPGVSRNSVLFNIEVIQIPLAHPEQAKNIGRAPILAGLEHVQGHRELPADSAAAAARRAAAGGRGGRGGRGAQDPRARARDSVVRATMGPVQCHDITVYPAIGRAGGACAGYGVLLDITDAAHPKRISAVSDSNFSFWHSATFNNDGNKVIFTDEWGGGTAPRCRSTDKPEWGADAVFTLSGSEMSFKGYYKLPAAQTSQENCVAHNGSLIPIPGRDVMVQGWYQGGISVFDFTDAGHAREIAYFDRGPMNKDSLQVAGSWSAYWYNGTIYSSEIARGLDIFELQPSGFISQNELDAAKTVHMDVLNVQDQPKLSWPPSFALARAYTDQLERNNGLAAARVAAVRTALSGAEGQQGQARKDSLTQLATSLAGDANGSSDAAKVKMLQQAVSDLAK